MQEEAFPAADRILCDIEAVLKKDSKLGLFEIVPVTQNTNKSPVLHVEHCLGLESWCVRHVYCHAYRRIMDVRQHRRRKEEPEQMNRLLIGALMLNPDVSSLWNMRRELVEAGRTNAHFELHLCAVVLSHKPKSAEAFGYRKWIVKKLLAEFPADPGLLANEFHICNLAAERYPSNYHAWNHRIWCLSKIAADIREAVTVLTKELNDSEAWVRTHVSDHSGLHYRQHLISRIVSLAAEHEAIFQEQCSLLSVTWVAALYSYLSFDENCNGNVCTLDSSEALKMITSVEALQFGLITSEIFLSTNLIRRFPGHEAVWCHRRYLLYLFTELITRKCNQKSDGSACIIDGASTIRGYSTESAGCYKESDGVRVEKYQKVEYSQSNSLKIIMSRLFGHEMYLYNLCHTRKSERQEQYSDQHWLWLKKVKMNVLVESMNIEDRYS